MAYVLFFLFSSAFAGPGSSSPKPSPVPSPSVGASRLHAELLQEMVEFVFNKKVKDRVWFGSMVDSMNQGASFEGVYNGLVLSREYRELEEGPPDPKTKNEVFGVFLREMVELEASGPEGKPVQGVEKKIEAWSKSYAGANVWVLKRVLGQRVKAALERELAGGVPLPKWYGRWVVGFLGRHPKLSLGVGLRSKPDATFHENWAKSAGSDLIEYEVLNRVHRVLNVFKAPR